MIRFAINGYQGRMGQAVSKLLEAEGLSLSRRFEKGDDLDLGEVDCVIDFTTPQASLAMARALAEAVRADGKKRVQVIGSTGFTSEEVAHIQVLAKDVVIIKSGNFSLGINILMGLVAQAAQKLEPKDWDIEITEAHHRRKIDAPSGTALMLGEAAAQGRGQNLKSLMANPRHGVTGPRPEGEIGFSVIRGGDIIGEHSVILASNEEVLTLSHSARDRSLFAKGALKAGQFGWTQGPGLYDMQDVLGFTKS